MAPPSVAAAAAARMCLASTSASVLRHRTAVTLAAAAAAQAAAAASSPPPPASKHRIIVDSLYSPVQIPDATVPQYLWQKSGNLSHHPCISCGISGRSLSYENVRAVSRQWALALCGLLELKQGNVIALLLPNVPEYVPAVQGALLAGLRVTMANPLYTAEELRRQFGDAGAKAVLTVPALAGKAAESVPAGAHVVVLQADDDKTPLPKNSFTWEGLLSEATEAHAGRLPPPNPDEVAALPYSSGTTGMPKGVMLTHRNLVANLAMLDHPELKHTFPTTDTYQDVALTVLPFFHIYGFNGVLNTSMLYGLHTVSMPVFTPDDYLRCLEKYKPSSLFVVPSLLQFLAVNPSVTREMLAPLRTVVSGAAPATQALIDKFREKVGRDDVFVRQGYGMTESSPVTIMMPPNASKEKEVSMGILIPNTRARVVRQDGADAGPNEKGELLISGAQVMKGYLGNEKATRETIDEEGWLHTGDVVYYDKDGFFYTVDRTKELIKVKGNQVSPTEMENLIMEIPQVADCAVIGVPDPRTDEAPRAFVVLKQNTKLTPEEIHKHIEPKVIKYKRLTGGIFFLDKIPRNPSGKIQRQVLKQLKPE